MKHAHRASWILFALVGAAITIGSVSSLAIAYGSPGSDLVAGRTLEDATGGDEELMTGLRARRGTAASFALSYAVLVLTLAVGPHRRGERWALGALTLVGLLNAGLILIRIPILGTTLGTGAAVIPLVLVLLAVVAGYVGRPNQPSPA